MPHSLPRRGKKLLCKAGINSGHGATEGHAHQPQGRITHDFHICQQILECSSVLRVFHH